VRRVLLIAMSLALLAAGTTQRSVASFTWTSSSAANVVGSASDFGTPLRGLDVQADDAAALGRIDVGDTLLLTYSQRVDLTSVIDGWDGTGAAVVIHLRDGAVVGGDHKLDDHLEVLLTAGEPQVAARVGSVDLGADYLKQGRDVTVAGTLSATTASVGGRDVTVLRLRFDEAPLERDGATAKGPAAMVWAPPPGVRDVSGATGSTASVTEGGPLDNDL
jgi:chitinase